MKQTYKNELKETIKLSLPIMIAQLGAILMGVTDNILVGRYLGATSLGAAGLANSLSFLVSSIGLGGFSIIASLISKAKGEQNETEISRLFYAGLRMAVLLAVVLGIASVILGFNFEIFRQTAQITALAKPFMYILSMSLLPFFVFVAARQLCDGLSFPTVAMTITVSALFINGFLNYALINGAWGLPKLGLNGSATATLIARCFTATAMLLYLFNSQIFKPYLLRNNLSNLNQLVSQLLKLGLPGGFQFFFEIAAFSLAVVMIGWLGENQLAAHQIAINLASATYMTATGISAAGAIRVGRAFGQKNKRGIFMAGSAAFALAVAFMGVCCIVFLTANHALVSLYITNNQPVMSIATNLVIIAGFFQLSDGIQVVALGALRGITDVNIPTIITFVAYWVVALPLSYVLAFTYKMDVTGVWIALSLGLTVSAVLLTWRFYHLAKTRNFQ
jgi:multidrug resistance protein, MATE family